MLNALEKIDDRDPVQVFIMIPQNRQALLSGKIYGDIVAQVFVNHSRLALRQVS